MNEPVAAISHHKIRRSLRRPTINEEIDVRSGSWQLGSGPTQNRRQPTHTRVRQAGPAIKLDELGSATRRFLSLLFSACE